MYHRVEFIGRLTKDPEMRYTPSGKAVCNFTIAVDDGFGEDKKTIWVNVATWEKQAESCNKFLKKASLVFVEGRLQHVEGNPRVWESNGKHGASYEVVALNVRFLTPKDTANNETPF